MAYGAYSVRRVLRTSLAAGIMMTTATLPCSADQGSSSCFIEVNAGLLSVKIDKADLGEVLRIVGKQAGARVSIQGDLGNVQPQVFWGVPLAEGIKRLVQNSNTDLVVIYDRDEAGYRYLKEVRAYASNRSPTSIPSTRRSPTPAPPPLVVPAGS